MQDSAVTPAMAEESEVCLRIDCLMDDYAFNYIFITTVALEHSGG